MAVSRAKHGAGVTLTSSERKAFLAARAQSEPAIREAREALAKRLRGAAHTPSASLPASLTLLYESCDGKLCLFQTADGHLSAVDSSRLA